MSYKQYSIIPSASMGETIGIVTEMMKISSSRYPEDLTPGQETRAEAYYPDRIVTSSIISSSFTGLGLYKLTDAEADEIRNDPLISSVNPITTESITFETSSTIPDRNVRGFQAPNLTEDIDNSQLSSKNPYYHSLPLEKAYSGSFGQQTFKMFGGDFNAGGYRPDADSFSLVKDINYSLDGSNVDVVIMEFSTIQCNHSEWYDREGNNRVKFIDWREYDDDGIILDSRIYNIYSSTAYSNTIIQHRQKVANSAVGLTNGFAKGSNLCLYPLNTTSYTEFLQHINILIKWNNTKPINPKTGKRNRTVVNWSIVGSSFQLKPYSKRQTGNSEVVSSSFYLPPSSSVAPYKSITSSIRIESLSGGTSNYPLADYIYVPSDKLPAYKTSSINDRDINSVEAAGFKIISFSGGYSGLADVINNPSGPSPHPLGIGSVQFNATSNIFSITSSTITSAPNNKLGAFKIFTGSAGDFLNRTTPSQQITDFPRGGHLMPPFSKSFENTPRTNISRIVVKGTQVYTGSNGFINSDHNFSTLSPVDFYGLDRGNNNHNNMTVDDYQVEGMTGLGAEYLPTLAQSFKEMADEGIINIMSSGNRKTQKTMKKSSYNLNDYYEPSLYSEDLWNTYIEFAVEYDTPEGPIPPNSPIRLGNPSWTSDYTAIQVGSMDLNIRDITSGLERDLTIVGGGYSEASLNGRISPNMDFGHGAAISVYALDSDQLWPTNYAGGSYFSTPSSSFYNTFDFLSSSISASYSQDWMAPSLAQSTTGSDGLPIRFSGFTWSGGGGGGTSFAAPIVVGMVACYLEANPDANFIDVRNWLHKTSHQSIPNFSGNSQYPLTNKFLYKGHLITSSVHPAYYDSLFYASGGLDLGGRNGNIAHFPYNSPMRGKLSNITMSRS